MSHRWRDARPGSFWLDDTERPPPREEFSGHAICDLVVIGGGFTGLWACLQALERSPGSSVILVESSRIAEHASGRNGGFCAASLTHGDANGRARWPEEMPTLRRLGHENLSAISDAITRYDIDCHPEKRGELDIAVTPWQRDALKEESAELEQAGVRHRLLDGDAARAEFDSPLVLSGLLQEDEVIMLNPARLAWGLASAIESLGGVIAEHSPVTRIQESGTGITVRCAKGTIEAASAVVATSAFPALVKRTSGRVVPVYDYVLMSEPLSPSQLGAIGWTSRRGVADSGNQFHYLRLTDDDRILFGGYAAVHRFGQKVSEAHDEDPDSFTMLEDHFDRMFPALEGIGFSHRWGGAIDTSTRFCASVSLSHHRAVATVNGFTGLGVGASRFFAGAALDLLDATPSVATSTTMIATRPIPFPPEPFRSVGISATRRAISRADENEGQRGPWLRTLDRLGLGFDS